MMSGILLTVCDGTSLVPNQRLQSLPETGM